MKKANFIALLLSITASSFLWAQDSNYSEEYLRCMDKSDGITVNILDCNAAEHEIQDARLNNNYKLAMQALSPDLKTKLRDAQRLWIKYRDADCGLVGQLTGGTLDSVNGTTCYLEMTKKRADDLQWLSIER